MKRKPRTRKIGAPLQMTAEMARAVEAIHDANAHAVVSDLLQDALASGGCDPGAHSSRLAACYILMTGMYAILASEDRDLPPENLRDTIDRIENLIYPVVCKHHALGMESKGSHAN